MVLGHRKSYAKGCSIMIDNQVRRIIDKPLIVLAKNAIKIGLDADKITFIGFGVGILAGGAIMLGQMALAIGLILLSRLCDGLDGSVARLQGPSDRGAFLDISLDFLFYGFIPLSFAVYDSSNALAVAFLLFSFIGTGTSFLSYAAIAEKRGIDATSKGSKGIYYLGGLTEGTETIIFLCICCYWPHHFVVFATIFACLCLITTAIRLYRGLIDF